MDNGIRIISTAIFRQKLWNEKFTQWWTSPRIMLKELVNTTFPEELISLYNGIIVGNRVVGNGLDVEVIVAPGYAHLLYEIGPLPTIKKTLAIDHGMPLL